MEKLIYAAGITGLILLVFVTIALVALNWSEKTLTPVLSVLLVGTATTLVTVAVQLKKSTIESAFAASLVLDTVQGTVPLGIPEDTKASDQLSELFSLANPLVFKDGKTISTIQKPTTENERSAFGSELLQYRLLHIIEQLQRGGWKGGYSFGTSFATVSTPMKLPGDENLSSEELLVIVASNRFSNSDMEQSRWRHSRFPLPPKTRLRLDLPPPNVGGKYEVILEKPMFFRIEFGVEPIVGTLGALPKGLSLQPEVAARCQTYHFRITMRATFERITAGNSRTQDYKEWVNRLFAGVKDKLEE